MEESFLVDYYVVFSGWGTIGIFSFVSLYLECSSDDDLVYSH